MFTEVLCFCHNIISVTVASQGVLYQSHYFGIMTTLPHTEFFQPKPNWPGLHLLNVKIRTYLWNYDLNSVRNDILKN